MKKTYIIPETHTTEKVIFTDICVNSPSVTGNTPGEGGGPGYGGVDDGTHDPDAKFRDDLDEELLQQMEQNANSNRLW